MKSRVLILLISLCFALSLSVVSNRYVYRVMTELDEMRKECMQYTLSENRESALLCAREMLSVIEKNAPVLEMLTPHEDLHDLILQLNDVSVSLEINDLDDYRKAISLFEENIKHLISHESISFSNIF